MRRGAGPVLAIALALALALVALVLGGHRAPGPAAAPRVTEHQLRVGGLDRRWTEVAPAAATPGGPLVLGLPGLTETPARLRADSGLDRLVARDVTVAYVEGDALSWDAGTCCGGAAARHLDDLAVLHAVAADLAARRGLDARRTFLVGHSNGAMMALRAVCEEPTRWAGALSVAGAVVVPGCDARGTRVVVWQGERDTLVPVAGRVFPTGGSLPPLATTLRMLAGASLTVLRDPVGTHDWPRPRGALVDRAWVLLEGARSAAPS